MWQKMWIDKVTKSRVFNKVLLILIWVGFSGVRFAMSGEGVKLSHQKLFRIMPNLKFGTYAHTHM